jgi:hypothetical protein
MIEYFPEPDPDHYGYCWCCDKPLREWHEEGFCSRECRVEYYGLEDEEECV